jgi:thioredoxin 1
MDDELEEIREQKLESLKQRSDGAPGSSSPTGVEGGAETPDEPVHVEGDAQLQDLVDEHDVVLVDFYADWCGPCKMLAPVVETIAADTGAAVAKVDVDANQQLAAQFQVRGVPTVVIFADGEVVEQFSGVRGEEELRSLVASHS